MLLALSFISALEKQAVLGKHSSGWPLSFALGVLALSVLATTTGILSPKLKPQWPDPVASIQSLAASRSNAISTVKKIGYTSDDTHLGGSFVQDSTLALTVISSEKGYLRGETRDLYTGKGWISTVESIPNRISMEELVTELSSSGYPNGIVNPGVKTKMVEQKISIVEGSPNILFGLYQEKSVQLEDQNSNTPFFYSHSGMYIRSSTLKSGDSYRVESAIPYTDVALYNQLYQSSSHIGLQVRSENLQQQFTRLVAKGETLPSLGVEDPVILQNFMQDLAVPSEFPKRDQELAHSLTEGLKTDYDKAKAIEQYLRSHYIYDTKNIPVPGPQDDFVDQFLFETKRGYCDHFSSSMVLLARSVGLPARWVTGYTGGTLDSTYHDTDKSTSRYIIKNSDAHSWAEVYLRGVGWVPFEATASFTMPALYEVQDTPATAPVAPIPLKPKSNLDNAPKLDPQLDSGGSSSGYSRAGVLETLGVVLGTLVLVGILNRRKLWIRFYQFRSKQAMGPKVMFTLMDRFLSLMKKLGWSPPAHLTLREYQDQLQPRILSEWVPFLKLFEEVRYGKKAPDELKTRMGLELFGRMLRKISRKK